MINFFFPCVSLPHSHFRIVVEPLSPSVFRLLGFFISIYDTFQYLSYSLKIFCLLVMLQNFVMMMTIIIAFFLFLSCFWCVTVSNSLVLLNLPKPLPNLNSCDSLPLQYQFACFKGNIYLTQIAKINFEVFRLQVRSVKKCWGLWWLFRDLKSFEYKGIVALVRNRSHIAVIFAKMIN